MALTNNEACIVLGIFVLVFSRYVMVGSILAPKRTTDVKIVRTKYGDVYDCMNIYKQPSLEHPLLKDHKIQLRPSFASKKNYGETTKIRETLKNVCTPGTVPIPKTRTRKPAFHVMEEGNSYHFAGIHTKRDFRKIFRGVTAHMSVYNPKVGPHQSSGAIISIQSGPPNELNNIKVGWVVDPDLYGNTSTRLFTSWKANSAGCYNLQCNGFVQTDHSIPIDNVLVDISITWDVMYESYFGLQQDKSTGHWWYFTLANNTNKVIPIGYWPRELFTHLNNGADYIEMGGEVHSQSGDSTYPPMGSGLKFDNYKYRKTSYISQVIFLDDTYTEVIPDNAYIEIVVYRCYLAADNSYKGKDSKLGYSFLFGGRGGNDLTCLDFLAD